MENQPENSGIARKSVEEYIKNHNLEVSLNLAINRVVHDRPDDPFMALSSLLKAESKASQRIISIEGQQTLDNRGIPSLMIILTTTKGVFSALVPSENLPHIPLTDPTSCIDDDNEETSKDTSRLKKTASEIQSILQPLLENLDPKNQNAIDNLLMEPRVKEAIGSNGILATSIAVCKAGSNHSNLELYKHIANLSGIAHEKLRIPVPAFSLINGGKQASNPLFLQDIMAIPTDAKSFEHALHIGIKLKSYLKELLEAKEIGHTNIGQFGGFAAMMTDANEALAIANEAITTTINAFKEKSSIRIALHIGASEFVVPEDTHISDLCSTFQYNVSHWNSVSKEILKSSDDLFDCYKQWYEKYRLISIIDPFAKEDFASLQRLHKDINDKAKIADASRNITLQDAIGGDIQCRLQVASSQHPKVNPDTCDTFLLDLLRYQTVSEAISAAIEARSQSIALLVGCTDRITDDPFVVDFAMGIGSRQILLGGLNNYEHMIKYNRLLSLSNQHDAPPYSGEWFRKDLSES